MKTKKKYIEPQLRLYGTVWEMTHGKTYGISDMSHNSQVNNVGSGIEGPGPAWPPPSEGKK
ncbi:MAG: hypothetical protein NTX50_31130 [Candidatus Sumerlaeota bacterium]|nr:hypothetical protein [Candidatus Sumerlaeota bacterium]